MTPVDELAAARLRRVRHKGPISGPEDPRHGTDTGYTAGCRKECCRRAHAVRRNLARLYPNRTSLVDATGTHRRLQALACLGWSTAELSRRLGRSRTALLKVMWNDRIQVETAALVAALYDALSATQCTLPSAGRTATLARKAGHQPPHAWYDIDDPDENPDPGWTERTVKGRTRDEVLEEFDWLTSQGETPEIAAERLGVRLDTVKTYRLLAAKEAC